MNDLESRCPSCHGYGYYLSPELDDNHEHIKVICRDALHTQSQKDCRPPSSAKDGSLWWLTFEGVEAVARWDAGEWYLIGHDEPATPESLNTWTVHSEVKFGEPAGVVATEMPIKLAVVRKTAGGSVLIVAGIEVLSWFGTSSDPTAVLAEEINAGFAERYGAHFRAGNLG